MREATQTQAATQSIEVDYDLPHPPAKVWRVLTEPALLARWLMENDFQPSVGHRFHLRATPIPGQWDGVVACEVLEVEPHRLLRYSWKGWRSHLQGRITSLLATL